MSLDTITAYKVESKDCKKLLSIEKIKLHLGIDQEEHDSDERLENLLECAIDEAETFLRCCIIDQQITLEIKEVHKLGRIKLPKAYAKSFLRYSNISSFQPYQALLMQSYDPKTNSVTIPEELRSLSTREHFTLSSSPHKTPKFAYTTTSIQEPVSSTLLQEKEEITETHSTLRTSYHGATELTYTAGWIQGSVPRDILQGILHRIRDMYDEGSLSNPNKSLDFFRPYKKYSI